MLLDISMCQQMLFGNFVPDCVRSNLRGAKFFGAHAPDPPSRHTCLRMRERAFACYYHLATILFLPPQLKILYETLLHHMEETTQQSVGH